MLLPEQTVVAVIVVPKGRGVTRQRRCGMWGIIVSIVLLLLLLLLLPVEVLVASKLQ